MLIESLTTRVLNVGIAVAYEVQAIFDLVVFIMTIARSWSGKHRRGKGGDFWSGNNLVDLVCRDGLFPRLPHTAITDF